MGGASSRRGSDPQLQLPPPPQRINSITNDEVRELVKQLYVATSSMDSASKAKWQKDYIHQVLDLTFLALEQLDDGADASAVTKRARPPNRPAPSLPLGGGGGHFEGRYVQKVILNRHVQGRKM